MELFRKSGGAGKPAQAGFKVAYADSEAEGVRIAYRRWANAGVPGELSRVLPSPRHFEQASELVRPAMMADSFVCGAYPDRHLEMIEKYRRAGFDELYVANTGPNTSGLVDLYAKRVLPAID